MPVNDGKHSLPYPRNPRIHVGRATPATVFLSKNPILGGLSLWWGLEVTTLTGNIDGNRGNGCVLKTLLSLTPLRVIQLPQCGPQSGAGGSTPRIEHVLHIEARTGICRGAASHRTFQYSIKQNASPYPYSPTANGNRGSSEHLSSRKTRRHVGKSPSALGARLVQQLSQRLATARRKTSSAATKARPTRRKASSAATKVRPAARKARSAHRPDNPSKVSPAATETHPFRQKKTRRASSRR